MTLKIESLPIDKLKFDPTNARKHSNINLSAIAESLKQFGQRKPIVITSENVIVAGNGTVEAARLLGLTDVDVVRVPKDWSADQVKAFALADNRTAELAEWNPEVLSAQLLELDEAGFDIEALGFDLQVEEVKAKIVDDEIPELAETAITKAGDLWVLGNHRLLCADATDSASINKLFEDRIAELCFTSPPYAEQREYNGGKKLSTEHLASFISVASNVCRFFVVNLGIARKDSALVRYWDDYISAAEKSGLKLLSWNVWNRQGFAGFSVAQITAMFAIEHEWILVFGQASKKLYQTIPNKGAGVISKSGTNRRKDGGVEKIEDIEISTMRQLGTIYSGGVETSPEGNHPATFPIDFPVSYIEAMTSVQDYVFEPFAGSGTTLIAAEKLARKCLALELDPIYCDVIVKRWEALTGEKAVLLNASR
jgi:DNA modification methylase